MENTRFVSADHEQGAIRVFVQRNKQERFLGFLANPKHRTKFTDSLAHFQWFDPKFATPIPWKIDPKLKPSEKHVQGIETSPEHNFGVGAQPELGDSCFTYVVYGELKSRG